MSEMTRQLTLVREENGYLKSLVKDFENDKIHSNNTINSLIAENEKLKEKNAKYIEMIQARNGRIEELSNQLKSQMSAVEVLKWFALAEYDTLEEVFNHTFVGDIIRKYRGNEQEIVDKIQEYKKSKFPYHFCCEEVCGELEACRPCITESLKNKKITKEQEEPQVEWVWECAYIGWDDDYYVKGHFKTEEEAINFCEKFLIEENKRIGYRKVCRRKDN